ncbi:MAG: GAF domain-containing protein [Halorhabdus sp.]
MGADEKRRHEEVEDVFERISDAFYAVDEEFQFTYLNERAEKLLQADAEDLLGKCVFEEYPEAKETDAYRAFNEALETQEPTEYELYYEPLGFWVNARVYPSETGLSVYFRDVTDRKSRERRLRQQRERLQALNNINQIVRDINRALVEQSSQSDIEELVCASLADSDSYQFAWIGKPTDDGNDVIASTTANTQGYLDDVTITTDDSPTGQGPTGTALRSGTPQFIQDIEDAPEYDPWRDHAHDRGFTATASIPIVYEDRQYGVLNIYTARENAFDNEEEAVVTQLGEIMGLAIAGIEYEQELQQERERLEFVNRLVRHNLLNSLNVVEARVDLLEPYIDPEAESDLETVRERTTEMIELVEKLRSLTTMLIESEEQELEPIALDDVLRTEIAKASEAYPQAEFEVAGSLEQADEVLADELLEEAVENVLSNAVQHNDKDVPRVVVSVERSEEMITVEIADNGPGVSEEMKEMIFQKGEKGFESPGSGFGLYLVNTIVESYGGTVSVTDNEPEGSVFSISLPRC